MHHAQTVSDMVEEVFARQAKVQAARSGEPLGIALTAILQTKAGRQLQELRDGPHRRESANEWQDAIAQRRARKQAGIV